ncbi:hypothetical protein QIS99_05425 [Streptomyces sp. B-S-A8]|uniref:Uncharacterized protein n=1 Tax=Streptomyces solicavernae TaxID=3043614 RepID=A0ABT6RMR1_9ACTN|nr:hypothetical protein [Streptomyces sp. B-S-A8]MDI3385660.1 hypothetical protein [Streptomyces sp. B-S-A8]
MPTPHDAKRPEAPNLPVWVTVPVAFLVAFALGEFYDFAWWQRIVAVVLTALALEAVNQAVRRGTRRGHAGNRV